METPSTWMQKLQSPGLSACKTCCSTYRHSIYIYIYYIHVYIEYTGVSPMFDLIYLRMMMMMMMMRLQRLNVSSRLQLLKMGKEPFLVGPSM